MDIGLYHVPNTRARNRGIHKKTSAFTLLTPPGLPAWPSSWPGLPAHLACRVSGLVCHQLEVANEHVLRCEQQHPPRFINADSPCVSPGISSSGCSRGRWSILANSFFGQFPLWPVPTLAKVHFGHVFLARSSWQIRLCTFARSLCGQVSFWPGRLLARSATSLNFCARPLSRTPRTPSLLWTPLSLPSPLLSPRPSSPNPSPKTLPKVELYNVAFLRAGQSRTGQSRNWPK